MKSFSLAAFGLVNYALAQNVLEAQPSLYAVTGAEEPIMTSAKNSFGMHVEERRFSESHVEKVIKAPLMPIHLDYTQQEHFIRQATEIHKQKVSGNQPIYTCDNREPLGDKASAGAFFPVFAADISSTNPMGTFEGKCFEEISFEFVETSETTFDVNVTTAKPKSHLCSDTIMFANTEITHFELFEFGGNHKLSFEMNTPEAQADVGFGGIKAFGFCEGIIGEIESLWNFAKCFVGGLSDHPEWPYIGSHVPPYMEKANLEFLETSMGLTLEERTTQKVEIDPDLINSGDFLAIMRLDGLDPIIMYGTGSHIGHSTMALRFDGELYVVESQDVWYWPTANLQRTLYADWMKQAEDASFHVSWLPLDAATRAKFDEQAAQEFFFQTEGLPYGYHNFLYGWVDTPEDNWPPIIPQYGVAIVFSILEKVMPTTVQNFFTEALNKRLGVEGKNIAEITELAAEQNMGIDDVMAMVELDGWEYTGEEPRDGLSYVCSAYVAAMYKAAGLFDDMDIQATEFTPRDVYSLAFFDVEFDRPQVCVDADPSLPYCQLLGKYRMTLPGYSTVAPYPHMNESCTVNWPDYTRDDGC